MKHKYIEYKDIKIGQFFCFAEHAIENDIFLKVLDGFIRLPNIGCTHVAFWSRKDNEDIEGQKTRVYLIDSKKEAIKRIRFIK